MPQLNDFLNPTSMLTPGIAGGIATSVSMPLALNFHLSYKWTVLLASFLLSILVVRSINETMSRGTTGLYVLLNGLVIFSVSIGAGKAIDEPPPPPNFLLQNDSVGPTSFDSRWQLIRPVFADEVGQSGGKGNKSEKRNITEKEVESSNKEHKISDREKLEKLTSELKILNEKAEKERSLRLEQEKQLSEYQIKHKAYDARWSWR